MSFFFFPLSQYPPPLVPPRGEVNAADAFDIGSFDEDDVKGIKVHYDVAFIWRTFYVDVIKCTLQYCMWT